MLLTALAVSVGAALLLAAPVGALVALVSGVRPGYLEAATWSAGVLFLVLAPVLILFTNRPMAVNLEAGLIRVGWRSLPIEELRHANRWPGGKGGASFSVQLEVSRGLDVRLPIVTRAFDDLGIAELEVLLEVVRRAPIVPRPGLPVRSPVGEELGVRSEEQLIEDRIADALQPFGKVAYAKESLLAELEGVRGLWAALRSPDAQVLDQGVPDAADRAAPGVRPVAPNSILPKSRAAPVHTDRGLFGTLGRGFRSGWRETEAWLRTVGVQDPQGPGRPLRVLGWVVIAAILLTPPLGFAAMALSILIGPSSLLGGVVFAGVVIGALALAPFFVWTGLILRLAGMRRRQRAARASALERRGRGIPVPESVAGFFAPKFVEASLAAQVYVYLIWIFVWMLAGGLVIISLGLDQVVGPYTPQAWQVPVGWLMVASSLLIFVGVLRWQRHMWGEIARAEVEWRILAGL